ncbi:MAG: phosphopyruvate hydratase [bacterium]|nr:phosphopyruvate hydratase [bacterium]
MAHIKTIRASEILDSRGNPTVRVRVFLDDGSIGVASVPSGASTGSHEALELRDGDKKRYGGKGVLKAVAHVNGPIAKALTGLDVKQQRHIDEVMNQLDGTENKSRLGANAILGVSLAVAHAGSVSAKLPLYTYLRIIYDLSYETYRLPIPTMNILNGGRHADSGLGIQEFMIIPQHKKCTERIRIGTEIFHALKALLNKKGFPALVGDEGGFAPMLGSNERAIQTILQAVKLAGYTPGKDVFLGLDLAASEFYDDKTKLYAIEKGKRGIKAAQMISLLQKWTLKYPLRIIEDGLAEDDWDHWKDLTKKLGNKAKLVGDDLFVTNIKRLKDGIDKKVGNAILIKLNQIGSLTETIDCIRLAQRHKYIVNVSHRSGETADTTIADLAVAVNAEYIKTGSLSRSERVEKYNRLMEIERELELSK